MAEIGVGMLGYAFMGKAHSNAYKKIAYITWPPPLEPRLERRRPRDVRDLLVRVGVRLAHERVPQHADADLSHRTRYYARQFNQRETKWHTQSSGGSSRRPT